MTDQQPDYLKQPLARFLDDAGARRPTPGGGSVSALIAALATTMGQMAANYTLGEANGTEAGGTVGGILRKLRRAELVLRQLIGEDMLAYRQYAQAAKLPADSPDRDDQVRLALSTAIAVPMEIAMVAAATLRAMDELKHKANRNLLGDLAVGAVLADAAARAAGFNIRENLAHLADRNEARQLEDQLDQLLTQTSAGVRSVQQFVEQRRAEGKDTKRSGQ